MYELTREVRFGVALDGSVDSGEPGDNGSNGFAAFPRLPGLGVYLALEVSLAGELSPDSQYVRNIKEIDQQVRKVGVPIVAAAVASRRRDGGAVLIRELFDALKDAWAGVALTALRLKLSPFLNVSLKTHELPMTRLSQRFEFSAAHRLHNPELSDEQNVQTFGKCNNPQGHGHNYEVEVELMGKPDATGQVMSVGEFERTVNTHAIDALDHKHLNEQVAAFADTIPSVENIARVIFGMLEEPLRREHCKLAAVTVWETPKTWCRYSQA